MFKAVFMDRDGTVSEEVGYIYHAGLYKPFAWAGPAIHKINQSGMKAVLITNQSGIGRGYFKEELVREVHDLLEKELSRHDAKLDAIYICPHRPDAGCECRKPNPGMLRQAASDLGINLAASFVIGDKYIDIEAAHRAGAKSVLVFTGYGREEYDRNKANPLQPDMVAENLADAVDRILSSEAPTS